MPIFILRKVETSRVVVFYRVWVFYGMNFMSRSIRHNEGAKDIATSDRKWWAQLQVRDFAHAGDWPFLAAAYHLQRLLVQQQQILRVVHVY